MSVSGFRNILGNEELIDHLKAAIAGNRVSHAYLISGDPGSGKKTLAEAFAMTLLCEKHGDDACGECASCRKVADRNHPDLIWVTHEKMNTITVDEIRAQVVNTVDILPYEGGRKIYIIPDAEKMNAQAQNALLKTIEEPPAYVTIILLAASPEAMLPTILSRCTKLSMKPVPDKTVVDYLIEEMHLPDYEAGVVAAFAQGNIGRARAAASDGSFDELRNQTLYLIRHAQNMDTAEMAEEIRALKEDKDKIGDIFDIMTMYIRDVLYFKATRDVDNLIFTREISSISANAAASSYEGLQTIIAGIDKCRTRLRANVNFELALELLLLDIKEYLHG
ncbi:MAG: DNA polymerase III subunit delta' [Chordicoccus sp.]